VHPAQGLRGGQRDALGVRQAGLRRFALDPCGVGALRHHDRIAAPRIDRVGQPGNERQQQQAAHQQQ